MPPSAVYTWPDTGFGDRGWYTWTGTTDSNGNLKLYNLFAGDNQQTAFNATAVSSSCATNGDYVYNYTTPCSASQTNTVQYPSENRRLYSRNSSPTPPRRQARWEAYKFPSRHWTALPLKL